MNTVVLTGHFEFGTQKTFEKAFLLLETTGMQLYKGEILIKEHHFLPESNQLVYSKIKSERVADNMFTKTINLLEKIAGYAICGEFNMSVFDDQNQNKTFKILPSSNDKTAVSHFQSAVALRKSGELAKAQLLLSQLIERYPSHTSAYMLRGKIFLQLNQPEQAVIDFDTALEINPYQSQARIGRVNAYRAIGTSVIEKSISDLSKVISATLPTQPTFWKARRIKGEVHFQHEMYQEALSEFKMFLSKRFEPSDRNFHIRPHILALAGVCALKLSLHADAQKYFNLSIESDADNNTLSLIAHYRAQITELVC
jgi:tetratricopeptide (TPR) repeat protein